MSTQPTFGGTAIKPEGWDRSGFEAFRYFLYDPKNGTILSRTPLSWAKITVFYIVYYAFLAAFWLTCLQIFFLTVPEAHPKWVTKKSLIGVNPGVGRRPVNRDIEIDSSIIAVDAKDKNYRPSEDGESTSNSDWAMRMDKFMSKYNDTKGLFNCDKEPHNDGKCIFDPAVLGECGQLPYGYLKQDGDDFIKPCIYLKLNKIYAWSPEDVIDPAELDDPMYDTMTDGLKAKIKASDSKDYVWMDCFGRYAADREVMNIKYYPENQGIPLHFFPYRGGAYHAPVVAVQLQTSKEQLGQLIHVECRAWYKGVVHSTKDMEGLIRYEYFVTDRTSFI